MDVDIAGNSGVWDFYILWWFLERSWPQWPWQLAGQHNQPFSCKSYGESVCICLNIRRKFRCSRFFVWRLYLKVDSLNNPDPDKPRAQHSQPIILLMYHKQCHIRAKRTRSIHSEKVLSCDKGYARLGPGECLTVCFANVIFVYNIIRFFSLKPISRRKPFHVGRG